MDSCPVCLEHFDADAGRTPHTLQCGHEYCAKCLASLLLDSGKIVCPLDKTETHTSSMAALPSHSYIKEPMCNLCKEEEEEKHAATHFCEDCGQNLCKAVAKRHKKHKATKTHQLVPLPLLVPLNCDSAESESPPPRKAARLTGPPKCAVHNEVVTLYDTQCSKPVCTQCLSLDEHHGHTCVSLAEAAESIRKEMAEVEDIWSAKEKEARTAEEEISAVHREVKGQRRAGPRRGQAEVCRGQNIRCFVCRRLCFLCI